MAFHLIVVVGGDDLIEPDRHDVDGQVHWFDPAEAIALSVLVVTQELVDDYCREGQADYVAVDDYDHRSVPFVFAFCTTSKRIQANSTAQFETGSSRISPPRQCRSQKPSG
jgi:hypothetical protein